MKRIELKKGETCGLFIVIKRMGVDKNGHCVFLCKCRCGRKKIVTGAAIKSGRTKSCGCFVGMRGKSNKVHGLSSSRFYKIWQGVKYRCKKKVKNYGGRGISVSLEWKTFRKFKDDMHGSYLKHVGEFGEKNTSIDRVDNNGDYCKENCRWATANEQGVNKRNNFKILFKDRLQTLPEWSREVGIPASTLLVRINRLGWSIEDALSTPVDIRKRNKLFNSLT